MYKQSRERKRMKKLVIALLGTAILTGCNSTPKAPVTASPISIMSEEQFAWDNDKSHALNVSRMGLNDKKEFGWGLVDYDNADSNTMQYESTKFTSFIANYYAGGVLAGLGGIAMINTQEDKRAWTPYSIDEVDFSGVLKSDLEAMNDVAQENLSLKIANAFNNISDSTFYGIFDSNIDTYFSSFGVFDGELCRQGLSYGTDDGAPVVQYTKWKNWLIDPSAEVMALDVNESCIIEVRTAITGMIGDKHIVNYSMRTNSTSMAFLFEVSRHIDMYTVYPSNFDYWDHIKKGRTSVEMPNSFVINKGEVFKFDKSEVSSKDNF